MIAMVACTSLELKPDSFPDGTVGVGYQHRVDILNANTPVGDVSILSGSLPDGLSIVHGKKRGASSDKYFKIEGLPMSAGTFTFRLYVACYGTMFAGRVFEKEMTIRIEPAS